MKTSPEISRLFVDGGPLDDMGLGAYTIGVTGSQNGWSEAQVGALVYAFIHLLPQDPTDAIHGGCVGVDEEAHKIIRANFPECRIHVLWGHIKEKRAKIKPDPLTFFYGPFENTVRNAKIAARPKCLFAFPRQHSEILRSGTWQTARMFAIMNRSLPVARPLYVVTPDGLINTEWKSELASQSLNADARKEWAVYE